MTELFLLTWKIPPDRETIVDVIYNTVSEFRACFTREPSTARKAQLKSRARENKFDVIITEALHRLESYMEIVLIVLIDFFRHIYLIISK